MIGPADVGIVIFPEISSKSCEILAGTFFFKASIHIAKKRMRRGERSGTGRQALTRLTFVEW
jgi:hypothetical protein